MPPRKNDPLTIEWEARAKNLLKSELKRRGITYAELARRLGAIGVSETERNLSNKVSRGGFSLAFFLQCMRAIGATHIDLLD